jgi:hypothetical protein
VEEAPASGPFVVITDQVDALPSGAAAALVFSPAETAKPLTSYWLASSGHPIGSYLAPVGVVGAALDVSGGPVTGTVVVSALVAGRQVPVVIAEEREGRRLVTMRLSPSPDRPSTAVLLSVFNSLRWLMGREQVVTVGESMLVPGFAPGPVSVRLPNGATQTVTTRTGIATYDDTTLAGMYRFRQGAEQRLVPVNFIDPLESNLTGRPSTWHAAKIFTPISAAPRPVAHPLANLFTWLVLALLLLEWWRYCAQGRRNATPFDVSGASPLRGQAPAMQVSGK